MEKDVIIFDRMLAEWAFCPVALWVRYFGDNSLSDRALEAVQTGKDLHGLKDFHEEYEIEYGDVENYCDQTSELITQLHDMEEETEGKPEGVIGVDSEEDFSLVVASRKLNLVAFPDRVDWRGERGWVVSHKRWNLFDPFFESVRLMIASGVVSLREHKFSVRYGIAETYDSERVFDFEVKAFSRRLLELENLESAVVQVKRILMSRDIPYIRPGQCNYCGYENCPSRGEIEGIKEDSFKDNVGDIEI